MKEKIKKNNNSNIITVKNLKKKYTSHERGEGLFEAVKALFKRKKKIFRALKGVSLEIKKGEVVAFLGPNGAGKSTTIKILTGVMYPDSGSVVIDGFVPWKDRQKYVRNIGAVFGQKSQLIWDLPPIDAYYFHKDVYKLEEKEFKVQLDMLIGILDIKDIVKRPTRQLSLGERMRCEFVSAMLHKPKIVFLDEPTIGLDIFAKETIRSFIKEMNDKFGTTFIVTSHDLEDIENLCDRVIVINKGEIVFDDKFSKLTFANKKHIIVSFHDKIDFAKLKKLKGIKVSKKISEYSVELVVNTTNKYLDEIIKDIRMGKRIKDMEIKNPPISDVIKKIYEK